MNQKIFLKKIITEELGRFLNNIKFKLLDHVSELEYDKNDINFSKEKFAYFMLKPDSEKNFCNIINCLEQFDIKEYNIYYTNKWSQISYELYEAHIERTPNFRRIFNSYTATMNEIYSDTALIFVIRSNGDYIELLKKIYNFKLYIRKNIKSFSYAIITNTETIKSIYTEDLPKTKIILQDSKGDEKEIYGFDSIGKYDIHVPNLIHCPDPEEYNVLRELKILEYFGVFKNQLNLYSINKIIKYKTYNVL